MLKLDSIVIVHLVNPTEKFWGVLQDLDPSGLMLRGLSVTSFDNWMFQVARKEQQALGLSTMFVPLFRVERIFLDEQIGEVESYQQRFESQVGEPVERFVGILELARREPRDALLVLVSALRIWSGGLEQRLNDLLFAETFCLAEGVGGCERQ